MARQKTRHTLNAYNVDLKGLAVLSFAEFNASCVRTHFRAAINCIPLIVLSTSFSQVAAQNRYATSDNSSPYIHWIDLYDAENRKIDPTAELPQPYSPQKTCGRCHDFNTISHGWHFNAFSSADSGRPGQPWIWSDSRTGTHLPLSYRGWEGTYNPDELGLSRWQIAAKFGGFLPGGGPGSAEALAGGPRTSAGISEKTEMEANGASETAKDASELRNVSEFTVDRSNVTGPLPVDCLMCHHARGSGYSPFVWTEQIAEENFAYAPTAALGLAVVNGSVRRLKDDFDPKSEDAAEKLPKVTYETSQFRSDGKVFIDLVRKPQNDACYYCHTNTSVDVASGGRWLHDEDVHIRAGMACADCHRNSLDHHTVRGFEGEQHPSGVGVASLSCQGCHIPSTNGNAIGPDPPGRLGSPQPAHHGLPPLHFDKLTCTACHSGPAPEVQAVRQFNSIAHRLGEHVKRTGDEFPGIVAGVQLLATNHASLSTDNDEVASQDTTKGTKKYTPHRMMWPSYWAIRRDADWQVLNPEQVYDLIRRPLKVRREFTEELSEVKLSLSTRRELLGEDRASVKPEEWTEKEAGIIADAEQLERAKQVNERMAAALAELEAAFPEGQAVYVTGGVGFIRDSDTTIASLSEEELGEAAKPYNWPLAHNVRSARQSLGASGCVECHSEESLFFASTVRPVGLLPDQETEPVSFATLQGVDIERLSAWNRMFAGRSVFKILGLIATGLTCIVVLAAAAANIKNFWQRQSG